MIDYQTFHQIRHLHNEEHLSVDGLDFYSGQFWARFGVKPSDAALDWRVPFADVIKGIQSVGGIAKLTGLARETVYRRKITPGSVDALFFVIDRWRGTARPLVTHADKSHGLNFDDRLPDVVNFCWRIARHGSRTVKTIFTEDEETERKWKRKRKFNEAVNPTKISNKQMRQMAEMKRLGQDALYSPEGRATVKMICNCFKIPRREFYRWKAGLTLHARKLLDSAIAGMPPKKSAPMGEIRNRDFETGGAVCAGEGVTNFDYDEIDARNGWDDSARQS